MSLNRWAKKRDAVEKDIVKALRKAGASIYLLDQPVDALCGHRNDIDLLEFKTGDSELNDNQIKFQETWKGKPFVILRSVDEALAWLNNKSKE